MRIEQRRKTEEPPLADNPLGLDTIFLDYSLRLNDLGRVVSEGRESRFPKRITVWTKPIAYLNP
jgi:hypothetical protein